MKGHHRARSIERNVQTVSERRKSATKCYIEETSRLSKQINQLENKIRRLEFSEWSSVKRRSRETKNKELKAQLIQARLIDSEWAHRQEAQKKAQLQEERFRKNQEFFALKAARSELKAQEKLREKDDLARERKRSQILESINEEKRIQMEKEREEAKHSLIESSNAQRTLDLQCKQSTETTEEIHQLNMAESEFYNCKNQLDRTIDELNLLRSTLKYN